jgi:hypothetical protein
VRAGVAERDRRADGLLGRSVDPARAEERFAQHQPGGDEDAGRRRVLRREPAEVSLDLVVDPGNETGVGAGSDRRDVPDLGQRTASCGPEENAGHGLLPVSRNHGRRRIHAPQCATAATVSVRPIITSRSGHQKD